MLNKLIRRICAVAAVVTVAFTASAFTADMYRESSALSQGRWVKVAVSESGVYGLSPAQLRKWGFSDPKRVRVCGYGGARIPDIMSKVNYVDDLPVVPVVRMDDGGIAFYGVGPEQWTASVSGRYARTNNIYTTEGYYFITEVADGDSLLVEPEIVKAGQPSASSPVDRFWQRLQHEQELTSPGQAGPQLVGEDFRLTRKRSFSFDLTDRIDNDAIGVWFECSFVAKTYGQSSQLSFTANGAEVSALSTDRISPTTNDIHYHGTETQTRHTLTDLEGNRLNLDINYSSPVTVHAAWLNYIAVNYQRKLQLPASKALKFWSNSTGLKLSNATSRTRIFDVTAPSAIREMDASEVTNGERVWSTTSTGWRTYVAFDTDATLPAPTLVGVVNNQNLHGSARNTVPDMVILCSSAMKAQAQRIANLHINDPIEPMRVEVVDIEQVYNEFSSGMADASGIRKYFKMLWDLGVDDAPEGYASRFRYAILLARATYDNRHLTAEVKAFNTYTIPNWTGGTMRQSLNDTDGYNTDDFLTLLKDNSGNDKGLDDLCIALGRIPARTPAEAASYIDKLEQYVNSSKRTGWKNQVMMLADDADNGVHMDQTEALAANMSKIENSPLFINKVYMDAYTKSSGQYPMAREEMFRLLDEGVMWWNFIGHANDHSLTHDGQLTYNDLNNMFLKHVPVFYAATCDFLRWDQNSLSGGEIMLHERYGGSIAIISATRPVYIYENGLLSKAVGRHLGARGEDGRMLTVGEIYRRSKNNILTDQGAHQSNANRLKYVYMGDPAMRLATPSGLVEITEIGGKSLTADVDNDPVELHALTNTTARGRILKPDGTHDTTFDGVVTLTLYDAEFSTTSNGYSDANSSGKPVTFEQQGPRLFAASAPVRGGEFEVAISVPVDITDNYRPAAISTYAAASDGVNEAAGLTRSLYVYGFDDAADADVIDPTIESMFLDHESFVDGGTTDPSPMLIAKVSDNVAINLSTAGIGHTMSVQIDGRKTYTDVAQFYTPAADGTPGGTINYPLDGLSEGEHELTLRVWDTSANAAKRTLTFNVSSAATPKIFDIYTDANPAHDRANFYLTHNRPDRMATVTVTVYNLMGKPLWEKTVTGVSDMFTSTPVTWDLTDKVGRRVDRGIYLYRATITVDGEKFDTGSRRIAVAGN